MGGKMMDNKEMDLIKSVSEKCCVVLSLQDEQEIFMQTIEEMGELMQAMSKYQRTQGLGQPTSMTEEEALENLVEEIADVSLMLQEMKMIFNINPTVIFEKIDEKLTRTVERLEDRKEFLKKFN